MDLPCKHELFDIIHAGDVLLLGQIGRHWHTDHEFRRSDLVSHLRQPAETPMIAVPERRLLNPVSIRNRRLPASQRGGSNSNKENIDTTYVGISSVARRPDSSTKRDLTANEIHVPQKKARKCSGCGSSNHTYPRCPKRRDRQPQPSPLSQSHVFNSSQLERMSASPAPSIISVLSMDSDCVIVGSSTSEIVEL
jgi:hypothetical protein